MVFKKREGRNFWQCEDIFAIQGKDMISEPNEKGMLTIGLGFAPLPYFMRPSLLPGETEDEYHHLRMELSRSVFWITITLPERFEAVGNVRKGVGYKRARIYMELTDGGMHTAFMVSCWLQIMRASNNILQKGPPNRSAFVLHLHAKETTVDLFLPRTFQGPITITYHRSTVLCFNESGTWFDSCGEPHGIHKFFIGDTSQWLDDGHGWRGDEIVVNVEDTSLSLHFVIGEGRHDDGEIDEMVIRRKQEVRKLELEESLR